MELKINLEKNNTFNPGVQTFSVLSSYIGNISIN